jgi:hypothetical protein
LSGQTKYPSVPPQNRVLLRSEELEERVLGRDILRYHKGKSGGLILDGFVKMRWFKEKGVVMVSRSYKSASEGL